LHLNLISCRNNEHATFRDALQLKSYWSQKQATERKREMRESTEELCEAPGAPAVKIALTGSCFTGSGLSGALQGPSFPSFPASPADTGHRWRRELGGGGVEQEEDEDEDWVL